eukprot:scaffold3328_cov184-Alexandrium_tamarense.AAC.3
MSHKRRRPLAEALPPPIALLRESLESCHRPEQRADDPSRRFQRRFVRVRRCPSSISKGRCPRTLTISP